jgi:OOP family OmpA-OmpF porin
MRDLKMMQPLNIRYLLALSALGVATAAPALEIVTKQDFIDEVVTEDRLVRLADNAIFLVDSSASTNDEFRGTGKSKLELTKEAFEDRNAYFPEIGHRFGVYTYTPWEVIYPLQTYDREKMAAALEKLPEKGSGPTPLARAIEKVEEVIKPLSGRTVLFLMYDGSFTGENPDPAIWRVTHENDVCLVMISSASVKEDEKLEANVARLNPCSRVVRLEDYLARPEYTTNALFDVVATETVVTLSQQRIGDVRVENLLFDFDKTELTDADKEELDALGEFMKSEPAAFAVLAGYTDNVGIERYNEYLARMRTEQVAAYLENEHAIDSSRLVLHWYGSDNPIASNATKEGRAMNRRVEVKVGGL